MRKERVYTEKIHAERLEKMLSKKHPCKRTCPAGKFYNYGKLHFDKPCKICCEFIGIREDDSILCPCAVLGKKETLKRSWLALEEGGYLK